MKVRGTPDRHLVKPWYLTAGCSEEVRSLSTLNLRHGAVVQVD